MTLVQNSKLFLYTQHIKFAQLELNDVNTFDSKLKISRTFLSHLLLLITSCLSIYAVHADELAEHFNVATIDFAKGYATIYPGNDTASALFAKRGMKIIEKDFIVTGDDGFISMSFSTGTVVNIQPLSKIHMEKIDCKNNSNRCHVVLKVIKGNLNTNVESLTDYDTEFTIETPYASAAVRGTIFDIDLNDTRLLTGVTEGQVNVYSEFGTVEVPENFGTQVQVNQPPTTPKPLLSAPTIITGAKRYDSGGELAWNNVATANKYLVSVSNTSGLVYSKQQIGTLHELQALDSGSYAAQVRAVDDDGFKGQVTEYDFDVVKIDNSKPGPTLSATVDATEYSVVVKPQNAIANLIELQFSATKDFEKLVNLDVITGDVVTSDRTNNTIYVRGRGVLNNTTVTPFGPIVEVPER